MEEKKRSKLAIYEATRKVPKNACREIKDGKLKGKTDINPMWRIKMLTEQFGPCGQGWYIEEVERWREAEVLPIKVGNGFADQLQIAVYVKIHLYYKLENGEWSMPLVGIGGSKEAGKGVGDGINDEAYKMAYTDAISVACKALGMAADIYWNADSTKYTQGGDEAEDLEQRRQEVLENIPNIPTLEESANYWNWIKAKFKEGTREFNELKDALAARNRVLKAAADAAKKMAAQAKEPELDMPTDGLEKYNFEQIK